MTEGREVAIHVDELVIDGPGGPHGAGIDRRRLAATVAAELGRLAGERGVRPSGAASGDPSGEVGRRVARAVQGVLGGGR